MKKTAVEWLAEQLCIKHRKTLINQAKEIENQRIYDAQVDILSKQIDKEKEMEKEQQGYSEEDIINALHSVELKDNKDYSKIYHGMKEWFEKSKNK